MPGISHASPESARARFAPVQLIEGASTTGSAARPAPSRPAARSRAAVASIELALRNDDRARDAWAACGGPGPIVLAPPAGLRIHLALGSTDMRRGFDGLSAQVQQVLREDPFSGYLFLFLFRGKRGDLIKALWWDGQGLCLFSKRLEHGRFLWPTLARDGTVMLTAAQLAMLLEGLDWRTPRPAWRPEVAV